MIKVKQGNKIYLGIEEENVKRLKQDKPIKVVGEELGIEHDIYIIYKPTMHELKSFFGLKEH